MKDAYSFDAGEGGVDISYGKMFDAYHRIFNRCGLKFRAVEADTGSIGGSFSHEFMVIAESGEDALVFCSACDYAANLEKAEVSPPEKKESRKEEYLPLEEVHTPGAKRIEEVCAYLDVTPNNVIKTLVYEADNIPVVVLVRGDKEVNEIKVKNYLECNLLSMATEGVIHEVTGSPRGFAGALEVKAKIIADYSVIPMVNSVMGANKQDYHVKNVNRDRDFAVTAFADLRIATEEDLCVRCGGVLKFARGIEVGHVFKLGTKYSKAMKATYLDQKGQEQFMIMGCYGIGIGRTAASCIEQNHDENGIVWPVPIAPYHVVITPVNMKDETVRHASENLYRSLLKNNIEVILDDRDERVGVKFNDAELIGIPLRITIGSKKLSAEVVEVKVRKSGEVADLPLQGVIEFIHEFVNEGV